MASIVGAAEEQKSFGSFLQKRTFLLSLPNVQAVCARNPR
jgi:hypothetical protein